MRSDRLNVRRIRVDLKDFDLSRLPELERDCSVAWVAVGKHMCGCCTDYAMIAYQQALKMRTAGRGLFIATCCHHRCEWESFSAKSQFCQLGFTPTDFEIVSWMTGYPVPYLHIESVSPGWALCDHQTTPTYFDAADLEGSQPEAAYWTESSIFWRYLPKAFRVRVGLHCKRLIDACRRQWLNHHNIQSDLVLYVPPDISPENAFLIGRPLFH